MLAEVSLSASFEATLRVVNGHLALHYLSAHMRSEDDDTDDDAELARDYQLTPTRVRELRKTRVLQLPVDMLHRVTLHALHTAQIARGDIGTFRCAEVLSLGSKKDASSDGDAESVF